jgi:transposase
MHSGSVLFSYVSIAVPIAASLGLTPKANARSGRERKGRIPKMGDRYLRRLLVNGMTSQLRAVRRKPEPHPWAAGLLARRESGSVQTNRIPR